MKQVGGPRSMLYTMTRNEADALLDGVRARQVAEPISYRDEGPGGALVHFADTTEVDQLIARGPWVLEMRRTD